MSEPTITTSAHILDSYGSWPLTFTLWDIPPAPEKEPEPKVGTNTQEKMLFTSSKRARPGSVIDEKNRIVRAVINTNTIDSYESIVMPKGANLERFKKNPQVLWNHDSYYPIGRALVDTIEITDQAITLNYQFYDFSDAESHGPIAGLVEDLWHLVKESDLVGYSVGFLPRKTGWSEDGKCIFEEWELLEFSLTPIPANPDTLASNSATFGRYLRSLARAQDPIHFQVFIDQLPSIIRAGVQAELREAKRECFRALERREILEHVAAIREKEAMEIQTIIFDKKKFSLEEAKNWCAEHGFRNDKVDETENTYRFRQFDPNACKPNTYRTWEIADGIQVGGCKVKDDEKTEEAQELTTESIPETPQPQPPQEPPTGKNVDEKPQETYAPCRRCQELDQKCEILERLLAKEKERSILLAEALKKLYASRKNQ